MGNVRSITRLYGTPEAATTTFTYEPKFQKIATVKDSLDHTVSFYYDSNGNLTRLADPLQHEVTTQYNEASVDFRSLRPSSSIQPSDTLVH
jgi:YD repeat-containing protein